MKIEAVLGDITAETTDAIVNAANRELMGGGGVDGAIWEAAGHDDMLSACSLFQGCAVGECKVTPGFALKAKWVIHTVGPVWYGGPWRELDRWDGRAHEVRQLGECYLNSLATAAALGCRSVAFPAIGTGAFRWPLELAARIAVTSVRGSLADLDLVRLVAYDERTLELYRANLERPDMHAIRRLYESATVNLPLPDLPEHPPVKVADLIAEGIERHAHR